ncbi:GDSL-type esterase/lipase family protein [Halobacillus massiliensis]|uniref:DUF459 domain-containing protein n=1 Tax=Halobacillus massiliensis TaxID=1926286 RepID=UPI0009E4630D|nr:GDSL-type esterase/lipase family protein [Halobacillus massiliensis]
MKKIIGISAAVVIVIAAVIWYINSNQQNDIAMTKEEDLFALGDSLTYGVGDESGNGYAENLGELLTENKEGKVTVQNFGIPGQQTDGLLEQINRPDIQSQLSDAEYFVIFIGTNDLIKHNGNDLQPLYKERIQKGKEDYVNNLTEIFEIIREENPDAPILFLGLYNPYPDSAEIEEVVTEWNDTSQEIVGDYEKIKFISTNDLFQEKSTEYFSDELHPNKKGYDLITQKILEEYDF